mmetsp:Transcript_10362/g.15935  ORF Transcript_10362/g.15935 Transcript_10362/m.15935 type:complete len:136 (+) Transcript_10362:2304-2711(+)
MDELRNDMSKDGWNDDLISPDVLHSREEVKEEPPKLAVEVLAEEDPWGQDEQISIELEEEVKVEEIEDLVDEPEENPDDHQLRHLNTITEMSREDDQTILSGHRKHDTILSLPSSPDEPVNQTTYSASKSFVSPL